MTSPPPAVSHLKRRERSGSDQRPGGRAESESAHEQRRSTNRRAWPATRSPGPARQPPHSLQGGPRHRCRAQPASGLSSPAGASIERALAIDAVSTNPTLSDIRHVVILMQENRSFDHYFGTLSGVRGFSDPDIVHNTINGASRPVWEQFGYAPIVGEDPNGWMVPFHLLQNPPSNDGDTTNDIDHSWGTQHASWNGGTMDAFVTGAHRRRRRRQLRRHHGVLPAQRPGVLLHAGRRLHDL